MILSSKKNFFLGFLGLFLLCKETFAQERFFKFSIVKAGIYEVSNEKLAELGIQDASRVSFFGYPGRLPQRLDSTSLELQEIPAQQTSNGLRVYLTGPHTLLDFSNYPKYRHHYYTDTLHYLIGTTDQPKRINTVEAAEASSNSTQLYQWHPVKEDAVNLLNSGRTWYSEPIRAGGSRSFPFDLNSSSQEPWKIQGVLMGASTAGGNFEIIAQEQLIQSVNMAAIPSTTYGVKGNASEVNAEFRPENGQLNAIRLEYQSSNTAASGYLDYLLVGMPIDEENPSSGNYHSNQDFCTIQASTDQSIWAVEDFLQPKNISHSGNLVQINTSEIYLFDESDIQPIEQISPLEFNLRLSTAWPDLLIISPDLLLNAAESLRIHKLSQGIFAEVISLQSIYDEFGYGNPDPVAIRNFIAWHFHQEGQLKNVLLFGKGTFDYKSKLGGRPNLIPTYTSRNSLNPLTTFSSDDFFGLIDFGQGEWIESREGDELLQIGVGRLPVINAREASIVVQKIINYESNSSGLQWKRNFTLMADDADNNIHLRDAESHSQFLAANHPEFSQTKLYLDRYEQINDGTSQRIPEAKEALKSALEEGTLFLNYIGHGNETTLAAEQIFRVEDIQDWPNHKNLPLWVTATCEFGRHDSPFIRSAAEELLTIEGKGAIGLLTTGRPVFSSINFSLNQAFIQAVFQKENQEFADLGSIFRETKNNSLNGSLNRNFSLLGDPSLKLASPDYEIRLLDLKNQKEESVESLPANGEISYEAEVVDPPSGDLIGDFNGMATIQLWDRPKPTATLGDESSPTEFPEEKTLLFQGNVKVENGRMNGKVRIPAQVEGKIDRGAIRIFAEDIELNRDAAGFSRPQIGGTAEELPEDNLGPEITLNLEGISADEAGPFKTRLIPAEILLEDSSGIDVSGLDPTKNLILQVNENPEIKLNKSYQALDGSFTRGNVILNLEGLEEGSNPIRITAFDLAGNETTVTFEIEVEGSERIQILSHSTFPNPASIQSNFSITHNRPGENLILALEVYTLEGRILFSNSLRLVEADAVIDDLSWIFLQSQTKYPAKGTYIYKIALQSEVDQTTNIASGKIIIE
ncbi:type IX secretion system sortase PorU [Algoriphagus hitonicola]|uniref:Peptidase family C25 n=1 Tax=Algoriphagus hitonicola TaxID=435880 RepID=A0A1I2P6U2_9BACT|nr:type IX secretion system sortase PorU [Algoriphagus hitonicola]SFG09171.1 Peptidase family C25 [Algoriphagus hitonicola]